MKLALVTIVTADLEPMRTFYQQVLQIEPQIYCGNYVEFPLEAGTLALWRQSECTDYGLGALRGAENDRVLIELEVAVRDHRGLSTACDVILALTSEVRLPIRTAACPLRSEPCRC
jgi:hypothetical protein